MTVRLAGGTRRPAQRHKSGLKCILKKKKTVIRQCDVGNLLRGARASCHSLLGAIFVLPWKTFIQHPYPPWQHPINPPLPFISALLWRCSSRRLWPTSSSKSSELSCVFVNSGRLHWRVVPSYFTWRLLFLFFSLKRLCSCDLFIHKRKVSARFFR